MNILRQLRHPVATISADANKCHACINHIVMLLLLLTIVEPWVHWWQCWTQSYQWRCNNMQQEEFYNIYGGQRMCDNPLQGLCQGNGAAWACWLMISSNLVHCYQHKKLDQGQSCQSMELWLISLDENTRTTQVLLSHVQIWQHQRLSWMDYVTWLKRGHQTCTKPFCPS